MAAIAGFSRLSLCSRLAYGVGHVFNDLCASMWFSYLLVYLQSIAGFSPFHSGLLLCWGQLVDAFSTPVIGYLSDLNAGSVWPCVRHKVWHIIGTICTVFSFPFLFTHFADMYGSTTELSGILQCGLAIALFQFGWAATQVSHLAFIPQLTQNDSERTDLSALRTACSVLSNVTVYALAWLLFASDPNSALVTPTDFKNLTLGVVVTGLFFTAIYYVLVRVPVDSLDAPCAHSSPKRGCREWFKEFRFYQIALVYTCSRLLANVSQTYWPMYLTQSLKLSKQYIAIVPLVMSASGFTVSLFMRRLISSFGLKLICMLGLLSSVVSCVCLWFLDEENSLFVFLPAFLNGAVGSILLITSLSMTNNLIGSQLESSAFVFGVMSFTDKLSSGVCIALIQHYHPCGWFTTKCHDAVFYYRNVMAVFPVAVAVVCFFAICFTASSNFARRWDAVLRI